MVSSSTCGTVVVSTVDVGVRAVSGMVPYGTPVVSPELWACWQLLTAACVRSDVIDRACFVVGTDGVQSRCSGLLERLEVLEAAVVVASDADGPTLDAFDCLSISPRLFMTVVQFTEAVCSRLTVEDSVEAWLESHYSALTQPQFPLGDAAVVGCGGNVTDGLRKLGKTVIPDGVMVCVCELLGLSRVHGGAPCSWYLESRVHNSQHITLSALRSRP
jgi:hypothetical protein